MSVRLDFSALNWWRADVNVGRFGVRFSWIASQDNPRRRDLFDFLMGPTALEALAQSKEELDTGRGYRWSPHPDKPSRPLATWRPDDPKQPEGWHHDGTQWVMDEQGWKQDRTGYWRYTKPETPPPPPAKSKRPRKPPKLPRDREVS